MLLFNDLMSRRIRTNALCFSSLSLAQASSDYVLPPNPAWAPFQKTRTVLLPDRLFEEHDRTYSSCSLGTRGDETNFLHISDGIVTQSRCSMGLLAEIDRAWVTVDHRLLLWDWSDGYVASSLSPVEPVKVLINSILIDLLSLPLKNLQM